MSAHRSTLWILALAAQVAFLPQTATAECVVASSVKLRSEPRLDAEVTGTLPIGAQVRRFGAQDGWVQVSELTEGLAEWVKSSGATGWVREEFLAPSCTSFREVLDAMKGAADQSPSAQVASFERAAAMAESRPERIEAMGGLARALEESGDASGAARVKADLETLRDPIRLSAKRERTLAVAVIKHHQVTSIYPLAYIGSPVEPLAWSSQWEATSFMARYLYSGRRYALLGIPGGALTVGEDPRFTLRQHDCSDSMTATGVVALPTGVLGRGWLATSNPVHMARPAAPLSDGDSKELARLARSTFEVEASRLPWGQDQKLVAKAASSPSVEGFAKDLDGDGKPELVGVVQFHGPRGALDGYVLMIASANPHADRPLYAQTVIGVPDSETQGTLRLIGVVDLDGDGVDELVIQRDAYEGSVLLVLVRTEKWGFRSVVVAGGGC
jgi:hypothetical protein